jgi:cysteine desulfurase
MGYIDSAGGRPGQAPDCVVYLDHAATTPLLPEALNAMTEELGQIGNASSLHTAGRRARRVVEESREQIAEIFGARPSEVIFTSGGTEADNLAVKGLYWMRQAGLSAPRAAPAPGPRHHGRASRGAGPGGMAGRA